MMTQAIFNSLTVEYSRFPGQNFKRKVISKLSSSRFCTNPLPLPRHPTQPPPAPFPNHTHTTHPTH